MANMIKGGFILQPRQLYQSVISDYPPHVREIWLYLLRNANWKDHKAGDKVIKRGQLFTSYNQIINDLSWYVGYRKESYKRHHCETAMKLLTKENMVTTTKTTRGMIVTVCKYDYYQNINNYETDNGTENGSDNEPTMKPHYKETKEERKERKKKEENSELKNSVAQKVDFVDLVIEKFKESYESCNDIEYIISNRGKERSAAGKLLRIYKNKYPDHSSDETLLNLSNFFNACVRINDGWLRDNMSLSIVINKFNQINKILTNGNQRSKTNKGVSEKEFDEILKSFEQ
jgi:hypothetical protein